VSLLRRYEIPRAPRTALIAALTIAAVLPPALTAIAFDRMISRTSTAKLAYDWMLANVPKDAVVVLESRNVLLPGYRRLEYVKQLREKAYEQYVSEGVEYLVASSQSFGPYLVSRHATPQEYSDYRLLFDRCQELVRFKPSDDHPGSELIVFKVQR
jgi:hypothetical protein